MSHRLIINHYLERDEGEFEIEITFDAHPLREGRRMESGHYEPDESPEIDIISVTRMSEGKEIEVVLTEEEKKSVDDRCWEWLSDYDPEGDRADDRIDQQKEAQ
jgi:hypothetical protein